MKWTDTLDIAIALSEKHPDIDPRTIRFTDHPVSRNSLASQSNKSGCMGSWPWAPLSSRDRDMP